jgi:tRNA threonylcarbamoyladenosine biosynthesis protein TsaE
MMTHPVFVSSSPQQTAAFGRALAVEARPGDVWALTGDLGAGKTHFVQGVAAGLGSNAAVTSPTFSLLHEYPGGRLPLFHFDFYRLRGASEALALGLDEYLAAGGLTVIEWAGKFPDLLPAATVWLDFAVSGDDVREIRKR